MLISGINSPQARAVMLPTTLMGSLLLKNRIIETTVIIMAMVLDSIVFPPIFVLIFHYTYTDTGLLCVSIVVPTLAGLFAELPLLELFNNQGVGRVKGIMALSVAVYPHIVVHINTGQIHQAEGPHGIV